MRKLIAFMLVVAFGSLLCQAAFSEGERPARKPTAEVKRPKTQKEEMRELTRRLRELDQELRRATAEARKNEEVMNALGKVREMRNALREAQQHANELLDEAIIKANPDLAKAVKERRTIREKLGKLRGEFALKRTGAPGRGRKRPGAPPLQPVEGPSPEAVPEGGKPRIVHFEIPTDNLERARKFYAELFGWKIEKIPGPMEYWLISTASKEGEKALAGGMMPRLHPQQQITVYFGVPSVDEYAARVEKLGGKVVVPKTAVPGTGYFAVCLDTENNAFAIWQTDEKAK